MGGTYLGFETTELSMAVCKTVKTEGEVDVLCACGSAGTGVWMFGSGLSNTVVIHRHSWKETEVEMEHDRASIASVKWSA